MCIRDSFLSGLGKTMISLGVITFLFVAFQLWGTGLEESNAQNCLLYTSRCV